MAALPSRSACRRRGHEVDARGIAVTGALRTVIAEDEDEARASLVRYLGEAPTVELVGVATNGADAVALVDRERPDLLLLDIQMPVLDGLAVLRRITHRPEIVFTTAYEDYAVAAFELGAVDYLVKPFGRERLLAALARLGERVAPAPGEAGAVERVLAAGASPLKRLFA